MTKYAGNASPMSTQRYEMAKGFVVAQDLIDYPKALVAVSMAAGDAKLSQCRPRRSSRWRDVASRPQRRLQGGRDRWRQSCDHYTYSIKSATDVSETGDLWLNATVPFGVVKHTTTTKDASGRCCGQPSAICSTPEPRSWRRRPRQPRQRSAPLTLKAAYDAGLIYVNIEIDPKFRTGGRAPDHREHEWGAAGPHRPEGPTSFHVDIPFDNFVFDPAPCRCAQLTAAKPAELVVTQLGEVRAVAGKFRIYTDSGKPYFSGSATTGFVK